MTLTEQQIAILAHSVKDPQGWADHTIATVGEAAIQAKLARLSPVYSAAKAKSQAGGVPYKNAAEREVDAVAERSALK